MKSLSLNQRQKAILGALGALFFVSIVSAAVLYGGRSSEGGRPAPATGNSDSPTTTATTTAPSVGSTASGRARTSPFTYQEAIAKYEGRRIQFDNCTSLLSTHTFKSGTIIMLDGRSPDPQVVAIGTRTYTLNGFDYKIVTLPTVKKPLTIYVDCETQGEPQYNIATIIIQP